MHATSRHSARLIVQRREAKRSVLGVFNDHLEVVVPTWKFKRTLLLMGLAWESNLPSYYATQIDRLHRIAR